MGVYIKGMEMPCEEAEPLRIELYADGTVLVIKEQDDFYEFKAVPVPPHGDLIDRDALVKSDRMVGKLMMYGGEYVYIQSEIDRAPTIIPASGGTEGVSKSEMIREATMEYIKRRKAEESK